MWIDLGLKINPDPAPSRGRRGIVLGTITELGMLPTSFRVFLDSGKVEDGDYHKSMTAELFEEYIDEICPLLKAEAGDRKAVIVMDNASYHSQFDIKLPTSGSRKQEIVDYLEEHNVTVADHLTKKQLLALLKTYYQSKGGKKNLRSYCVEMIAASHGVEILRLPPTTACSIQLSTSGHT